LFDEGLLAPIRFIPSYAWGARDHWLARELGIADEFGWDYGPHLEAVPRKFPRDPQSNMPPVR